MGLKRYLISCVVPGAKPHTQFLSSIKTYIKKNKNTELVLVPALPVYKDDEVDPTFADYRVITKDLKLNDNIYISLLPINPQASDPVMGLDGQTQITGSVILASPKQRLKSVPSPSSALPRVLMTPGAVTKPYYRDTRAGIIAAKNHVNGLVVVEIENSEIYHFRHTQTALDGSFADLGVRYRPNGKTSREAIEALIPGDYHCGFTDPKVDNVIRSVIKEMSPKHIILHDFADCISINHHIEHKHLERGLMGDNRNLTKELKLIASELAKFDACKSKVVVVKSNHDEFLDRYLSEGKYMTDTVNHVVGLELALAKAQGHDPLEYGIKKFTKLKNTRFLKSDESFLLSRKQIECGVHGHRGPNGSRGSASSLEKSYGRLIMGHSHSPEILRQCFVVGTSTHLKLSYNSGPSSWMQTMCILYKDGTRQLLNVIEGRWRI